MPVVALVETAAGMAGGLDRVAVADPVVALMLGAEDLAAELGLRPLAGDEHLLFARSLLVVHSATAGLVPPFDGVHVDLKEGGPGRVRDACTRAGARR